MLFESRGLRINNIHDMYDHHTMLIMKMILKHDSTCVDVGAHVGELLKVMARLAPDGKHYAFEPIPYLFSQLQQNQEFKKVTIYPFALSDEPGESTFFLVENAPAYSGLKQRRYDRPDPKIKEIQVIKKRLDDIVPIDQKIDLIKIDVEGAEMLVLRGAARILRECKPFVIFESGLGSSDRYGTDGNMLYDFFESCGMQVNTLDGFLVGQNTLTRIELSEHFTHTIRYYFIAHGMLSTKQRQSIFQSYILDMDSRFFSTIAKLQSCSNELPHHLLPNVQGIDWGEKTTIAGENINAQPDGSSAMWITTNNLVFSDTLHVHFGNFKAREKACISSGLITTHVPSEVIAIPGEYEVVIVDEVSGQRTMVGTFITFPRKS